MKSTYLQKAFIDRIDRGSIKIIVECGSRDCFDTIELNNYYKPDIIYSFECNPENIIVCENNIKGIEKIKLISKAVYNEDKKNVIFYATDMEKSVDKNTGASSLLYHRDNKIEFIQKRIVVEGIRLDTFMKNENINNIDLLCFDLQGTEHLAFEGLGERVSDVHYLITEVSLRSFYHGDKLMSEIIEILNSKKFELVIRLGDNILFENIKN